MSGKKGYSYLNDKRWIDITREERFFCLVAYNVFNANLHDAIKWINGICELGLNESIDKEEWELGFEVALYRDFIHDEGTSFTKEKNRFRKRTFDLCFFSEHFIIIIEAKAYSKFDSKQLEDFKKDKKDIQSRILEKGGSNPEVIFVALTSSHYSPKESSVRGVFDGTILTWQDMYNKFEDSVFRRADEVYPHSSNGCEVCKSKTQYQ